MFNGQKIIDAFVTNGPDIIFKITAALICGLLISWLYRRTYRGPGLTSIFVNTLIVLPMITAIAMMVIGNNLARAFGLAGAMTVVRFRTAVKNTQDIVYIFFVLAVGMAAGIGFYEIALLGTVFIGLVIYILSKSGFSNPEGKEYLLQFHCTPTGEKTPVYQNILDKYCKKAKIINAKSLGEGNLIELSYYLRFKDKDKSQDLIRDLKGIPGIEYINLFFDEEVL